jgi:hypothetical protein
VAGDAGASVQVGAVVDQELADSRLTDGVISERMEDRGLATYAIEVHFGAGVNIGAAIKEQADGVEEAVFRGGGSRREE